MVLIPIYVDIDHVLVEFKVFILKFNYFLSGSFECGTFAIKINNSDPPLGTAKRNSKGERTKE